MEESKSMKIRKMKNKMKCRGWQTLKASRKSGVSMAVMLCVSAFFLAFAAAILYTAGLITAQSTERLRQERCYQLARTAAAVVDQELTRADYTDKNAENVANTFYKFANQFLDGTQYADYDADKDPKHTQYTYILSGSDLDNLSKGISGMEGFGNLSVTLRKEKDDTADSSVVDHEITIEAPEADFTPEIEKIKQEGVRQYSLSVDVTAYYEDVEYTYTTKYIRAETFEPTFTYEGQTIYWNATDRKWKYNSSVGKDVTLENGKKISYTFTSSAATSSRFINVQDTNGGGE